MGALAAGRAAAVCWMGADSPGPLPPTAMLAPAASGIHIPSLPFWASTAVYHWANGSTWEEVRNLFGVDEGDLAMVILRTADHLRQIESLEGTHPTLATCANKAIQMILREPVLVE